MLITFTAFALLLFCVTIFIGFVTVLCIVDGGQIENIFFGILLTAILAVLTAKCIRESQMLKRKKNNRNKGRRNLL